MNSSTSDEKENIWDHPWTTDEMRQYRSDWSLASDVGLLKHLQQFSENLTATVKKTQTSLDLLNSELNDTSILIDNVTNASLALANTQFIESRVYEDETENKNERDNSLKTDKKELPNTDLLTEAEIISAISENIQQGLAIMDEKYEKLEVLSSDSEDENEIPQSSFILRLKDPYQNRPLPYVIGTDKWKVSNKIGLESSSSESEPINDDDEDENDSDSDKTESERDMDELSQHIFIENSRRKSVLRRTSSSLSSTNDSSDADEKSITNKQYSNSNIHIDKKLHVRSQDTLNLTSEITTPTAGSIKSDGNVTKDTPSFAEELAKRLGSMIPTNATVVLKRDTNQSSINRLSKEDLSENYDDKNDYIDDNEHVFSDKSDNLFSKSGGLFDDDGEVSNSLWKDKPIKRPLVNIIPPCLDIPPPMNSTETKQNSTISDLFGDDDSDNSDDIFAPKNFNKSTTTKSFTVDTTKNTSSVDPKFLDTNQQTNIDKITTSTPETNNNIPNLFEDDENDGNLFGTVQMPTTSKQLRESSQKSQKARLPGILVSQSDLLSSSLGSRLFQRTRQESTDSSENETEKREPNSNISQNNTTGINENNSTISTSGSSVRELNNGILIETSDSGVSVQPQSMNSTLSSSIANNWIPQMESTRLPSEELYRERVTSDSLFTSKTRQQNNNDSTITVTSNNQSSSNRTRESNNIHDENLFDNDDDVFSPPPLPQSKFKSSSKVTSLFDDSDSGDDLFSNTSSGSRSQKSADILTNLTQQQQSVEKSKSGQKRGGLFDEDRDIFTARDTSSGIDISTAALTSKDDNQLSKSSAANSKVSSTDLQNNLSQKLKSLPELTGVKPTSIFDDSEEEDEDLFSSIIKSKTVVNKFIDEDNLFGTLSVSSTNRDDTLTVPKKDSTAEAAGVVENKESRVKKTEQKRDNEQILATNKTSNNRIFPSSENKLFDDSDDDDDDNLFGQKKSVSLKSQERQSVQDKSQQNKSIVMEKSLDEKLNFIEPHNEPMASLDKSNESDTVHSKDEVKNESAPITEDKKISKINENTEISPCEIQSKKEPPKNLRIHLPITGASEDLNIPPRRAVSGKIKNLMGKMGDLKILSPTDTPLPWRKSGENPNSDDDNNNTSDRDSEDGSSISVPSTKSLPILPKKEVMKKELPRSPSIEIETAVSFDTPAHPDTLTVTASKSRARIPVKRRPQSRHARQSALRISGIDFDTVDTVAESLSDVADSHAISHMDPKVERLAISNDGSDGDGDRVTIKPVKPTLNLISDDKSEISLGKESSVSITKNTLLSPSTDEEDLFDVPPDLPEDSQREDSLFGRAPILSPVQRQRKDEADNRFIDESENTQHKIDTLVDVNDLETSVKSIENRDKIDNEQKLTDPLRDDNHDPLKDPSQLFAFVTKSPSSEKEQNLLFNEDNSLFSQTTQKTSSNMESMKKSSFDIFADDSSNNLFSGPFTKSTTKKPIKGTKNNLFNDLDSDDDDATDDLFGSASSKRSYQSKSEHSDNDTNEVSNASSNSPKQLDVFDDDDDEDLFFDASERPSSATGKDDQNIISNKVTKSKLEDIFGDESSSDDNIFTIKKPIGRGTTAGGLFFSDDNDDDTSDIFTKKQQSSSALVAEPVENRAPIKKAVTRDLRKTAEKIVKDPLSMLHDD